MPQTPSLGLVSSGGLMAARQAIRQIQQDALREQLRQEALKQQGFENDLSLRKQGEIERSNVAGEGFQGQGLDIQRGHLGVAEGGLTLRKNQDTREGTAFGNALADRRELNNLIMAMPEGMPRQVTNLRRYGVNIGSDELLTPTERGRRTAEEATAAWNTGGRNLFGERQRIEAQNARPLAPVVIQSTQGPLIGNRATGETRPFQAPGGGNLGPAPTAEMRNRQEARVNASRGTDAIRQLSKELITERGIAQRAKAIGGSVESALGKNPKFRAYEDARFALAGNLAVMQQGSRPSDADIRSIWLPLVPSLFNDTDESAAIKWGLIDTMAGFDKGGEDRPPSAEPVSPRALQSAGPGLHTFDDGSVWRKDADGKVTNVKPKKVQ